MNQRADDHERDDRATIAAFSTVVAVVIAALYLLARVGFDNVPRPVFAALGLSLFITVVPSVARRMMVRGHYAEPERWWRSQSALTLLALGLTASLGMLVPATGINLVPVVMVVGYAAAAVALIIWMRAGRLATNLLFLAGSGVFAVWVCGVAWSTRHKTPVFWETLEFRADVHHDPLYYVSMANNMRSYSVPSTGLDGVLYNPYHYGSAWLNSQWAYLAGTDVLSFYSLGPSVIAIPLFFSALLLLAVEVKKGWHQGVPVAARPLRTDYAAWLFFLAVTVGVIPTAGLDAMGVWNLNAMISESYVIGMPVFLLTIATATSFWRRKSSSLTAGDLSFLFLFSPIVLIVMGFLKVSLLLLLLAAGLGVALLGRLFRDRRIVAAAGLCLCASLVTYRLVSVAAQNKGIVPFAYMRFSVNAAWWPYFILVHLFWSWVYIYLRLREERLNDIGAIRQAALGGRITDVVVVAIVAIAGWLPGELIDVHGGSAIYFSDVQRWLALSLLMASAWRWWAWKRQQQTKLGPRGAGLGRLRMSDLWLAALAIPIVVTLLLNAIRAPATALRANIALRRALYSEAGVTGPVGFRSLADSRLLATGLQRSPEFALIAMLRELDGTPAALKRRTLLFIPQSYTHFWRIWTEPERCSFVPFIAPATSGLALLDGMPPADCDLTEQYGMTRYHRRTALQLPDDTLPASVCAKARAKGFSRVVVLDGAGNSGVSVRTVECRPAGVRSSCLECRRDSPRLETVTREREIGSAPFPGARLYLSAHDRNTQGRRPAAGGDRSS